MSSPPPPYSNVSGVTRAVMKFNAQEPFASYDGNARPGELVVDTSNYALYIGNADGNLNIVTGGGNGGGGGSNIANGTSNVSIATSGGIVTFGIAGNANVASINGLGIMNLSDKIVAPNADFSATLIANVINVQTVNANSNVTANGNVSAGNLITTGSLSSAANLSVTSGSNSWVFGTDGKLTLPSGGNITGDGSSPGPKLVGFDLLTTANANVGQTLNVVGNSNLSILNVSANANLQGGITFSGNIIANVTLNTGINPWSLAQNGGSAALIIDSDSVDISGNVVLPGNIVINSGANPAANTTATITNRLPVTINGNTYYIMLTS